MYMYIYNSSVYMLIQPPNLSFLPPHLSPLVTINLFS